MILHVMDVMNLVILVILDEFEVTCKGIDNGWVEKKTKNLPTVTYKLNCHKNKERIEDKVTEMYEKEFNIIDEDQYEYEISIKKM